LSDVLSWIRGRRDKKIIGMLMNHMAIVQDVIESLMNGIKSLNEGRFKESQRLFDLCVVKEEEADRLRRQIVLELEKGELSAGDRSDLMMLLSKLDMIADWGKEAVRILGVIPYTLLPEELKDNIWEMLNKDYECVKALSECIKALLRAPREALESTRRVEELEEEADRIDLRSRSLMVKNAHRLPIGYITLLDDFLHAIENIADCAEDTADLVQAIAIRRI